MKGIVFLTCALLLGHVVASPIMVRAPLAPVSFGAVEQQPLLDECKLCINFAGQFINSLLNIILNGGVVGTCGALCQALADKVNSSIAGTVCDLLCDIVGIEAFIKVIEAADLDPIYYCELLKTCVIKDDGDAKIQSLTVKPVVVPYGSDFEIDMAFQTTKGTGTGEISLLILTVDGIPIGDTELSEPMDPGSYDVTWKVTAAPDRNCDPTQQPCEMWLPGNYTARVAICNGECGSKHPHSQVYDTGSATFNVTKGL